MQEQSKVFVIIFRQLGQDFQYLALKPNPEPGRNTDYYVVTGGVEDGETIENAAKREVQEEIGTSPTRLIDLGHSIRYQDHINGNRYIEHCFAAQVQGEVISLNEEHIDYEWLNAHDFVATIWWENDRAELANMIRTIELSEIRNQT